jgi:hypothetical protein
MAFPTAHPGGMLTKKFTIRETGRVFHVSSNPELQRLITRLGPGGRFINVQDHSCANNFNSLVDGGFYKVCFPKKHIYMVDSGNAYVINNNSSFNRLLDYEGTHGIKNVDDDSQPNGYWDAIDCGRYSANPNINVIREDGLKLHHDGYTINPFANVVTED